MTRRWAWLRVRPFSVTPLCLCASVVGLSSAACSDGVAAPQDAQDAPRSVILLIGDGTGPQQLGLLMDWADAAGKGPTHFERFAAEATLGALRTPAADSALTDSAAAATALACGVATRNGRIAVDPAGRPLPTCLEDARAKGRRTGLVTTTTITHATPASFAAHVGDRGEEGEIALQYVAGGGADVMFGGGARHFPAPVLAAASEKGWKVVRDAAEMASLGKDAEKALGLFAPSQVPYAIDRDQPGEVEGVPSLAAMTRKALEILGEEDRGFFLMVEGGRIDHACHGNDAAAALGELREFDEAIGVAEEFRARRSDTLVIVTADHETGGLSITSGMPPAVLTDEQFLALARTEKSIEAMGLGGRPPRDFDPAVFGVGHQAFYPPSYWGFAPTAIERSARHCVTFSTSNHTTTPVLLAARGPGASALGGLHRNTHVGRLLREWMSR